VTLSNPAVFPDGPKGGTIMAKDPVCGMDVDEKKAAGTVVYKGKSYYFCSNPCKVRFEKEPEKYVKS
jgi:YHS domain-containing protein